MKKIMYLIITVIMISGCLTLSQTDVLAKSRYKINTVYNTSKTIKGKARKNLKVVFKIGKNKYSAKTTKKGTFKIKFPNNKLKEKTGKKITVKFYKKNKGKWKKVKSKKVYVIADTIQLNAITDTAQSVSGYTRPGYKIKLNVDGIAFEKKASAKKGYFKIAVGKNIKQCNYTLKIYRTNGSLYKSYTHRAGSVDIIPVFDEQTKPVLKKSAIKKSYKYDDVLFGKYKETKIDAYNLTWTKISGADGYDLYVYYPAEKVWEKIESVKSNSYKMTNLYCTKYKFRIKAYATISGKKKYGAASNTVTIDLDSILWVGNADDDSNYKEQFFTQRVYDENTFIYQNEIRKKARVDELVWSNVCYEIAKVRAAETYNYFKKYGVKGVHDECDNTIKRILENTYGADYDKDYEWCSKGKYMYNNFTENWASNSGNDSIRALVKSPLHYVQMINEDFCSGAISAYSLGIKYESTSAIYCMMGDLDSKIANGWHYVESVD